MKYRVTPSSAAAFGSIWKVPPNARRSLVNTYVPGFKVVTEPELMLNGPLYTPGDTVHVEDVHGHCTAVPKPAASGNTSPANGSVRGAAFAV